MSATENQAIRTTGVSMTQALIDAAREKAKQQGRSFSNYVRQLILQDLNQSKQNDASSGKRHIQRRR